MKKLKRVYHLLMGALFCLLASTPAMATPTIDLTGVDVSWGTTEGLKVGALVLGVVLAFFVIKRIAFTPSR